jgi:hypothetical protein
MNRMGPAPRLFRARFPNGTSLQRAYIDRVFTHAYLVLYEPPDAKDGFQRGFCVSLDEAEATVQAEMRWLSRHSYSLIEAFIVDVEDITATSKTKKRRQASRSTLGPNSLDGRRTSLSRGGWPSTQKGGSPASFGLPHTDVMRRTR